MFSRPGFSLAWSPPGFSCNGITPNAMLRVSRAAITPGNLITTADLLTTVVSDGPIYATFNTDEQTYLKHASAERGKAGTDPVAKRLCGVCPGAGCGRGSRRSVSAGTRYV